jgi:hypothetical protein
MDEDAWKKCHLRVVYVLIFYKIFEAFIPLRAKEPSFMHTQYDKVCFLLECSIESIFPPQTRNLGELPP